MNISIKLAAENYENYENMKIMKIKKIKQIMKIMKKYKTKRKMRRLREVTIRIRLMAKEKRNTALKTEKGRNGGSKI
jgi:hypothetical protein